MNGCNQVQNNLNEYLDGRLTGREMQEMGTHLQACPGCAQEWKSLRDLQSAVAGLGPVQEPADLSSRAIRRLKASSRGAESTHITRLFQITSSAACADSKMARSYC